MIFFGAMAGAIIGCLTLGVLAIVIGGAKEEYPPHDKE